eukprot:825760-Amphidinium_carterae.1
MLAVARLHGGQKSNLVYDFITLSPATTASCHNADAVLHSCRNTWPNRSLPVARATPWTQVRVAAMLIMTFDDDDDNDGD